MKWIASITMFIDHLTVALAAALSDLYYLIGRGIGRVAFPLYALLFVDSFLYTSSRKKYISNLSFFALVSEVPYDLTFHNQWLEFSDQNILFLFVAMGLLLVLMTKFTIQSNSPMFWVFILITGVVTTVFNIDYGIFGMVYMGIIYHIRTQPLSSGETTFYLLLGLLFQAPFSFIAIPLILFYNQNQQKKFSTMEKYFFYFFYPGHILVIYMIQALM